jgi:hypothetical protein
MTAYEVVMEVGREERRKDVISVLMRAEELGGQIRAEDICNSLLIDRPIAVGHTVISRCRDLGLLDDYGSLTPLGRESLERKTVPLPEHGRYRILCTTDPLVPQRILDLEGTHEPMVEDIVNARRAARRLESKGKQSEEVEQVPPWLVELKDQSIMLPRLGERIRIMSVAERCVRSQVEQNERLSLKWIIHPDRESELMAEGFAKWDMESPKVSHESIFLELLGDTRQAWDARRGVLRCGFNEVSDAEKTSMSRQLKLDRPTVSEYGTFDETEIRDVPIAPRTVKDAQEWGEWVLEHEITEYLDENSYPKLVRGVTDRFPDFDITLPEHDKMADQIRHGAILRGDLLPAAYWYLRAPTDLGKQEAVR